jgi:hypothetical protein
MLGHRRSQCIKVSRLLKRHLDELHAPKLQLLFGFAIVLATTSRPPGQARSI